MREPVGAACLPPGNLGSSHPCVNIAKCVENNVQQKNLEKQKNKKGKGRETLGAVVRRSRMRTCLHRCVLVGIGIIV